MRNSKKRYILGLVLALIVGAGFSIFYFLAQVPSGGQIEYASGQKLVAFKSENEVTDDESVYGILNQVKNEYGYENAQDELVLDKVMPTAFGSVYRFNQTSRGMNVFARGLNVSVDDCGRAMSVSGNFLADINLDPNARLSAQDAKKIVSERFECVVAGAELTIYSLEAAPVLAYSVDAMLEGGNYRIFVDANSGAIICDIALNAGLTFNGFSEQTTQIDYFGEPLSLKIENSNGDYYLADATRNIYMFDNKNFGDKNGSTSLLRSKNYYTSKTGEFVDGMAVSAFSNIIKTFDYYADASNIGVSLRGVDGSVDDIRDNIESNDEMAVHVYLHYGRSFENAFYVMSTQKQKYIQLVFGDGRENGLLYNPVLALDVVGHEYQHAVTAYTNGLIYQNASGAINEAYSDIFGALIDGLDQDDDNFWIIGEESTPDGKGLRSMKDPKSFGLPVHYDERVPFAISTPPSDENDRGGVHSNNTIITHIQYKMWEAMPEHFTKQNIGKLWYSALCILASNASFADLREVFCQTAVQLGWGEEVVDVMEKAFAMAGIGTYRGEVLGSETPEPPETPEPSEPSDGTNPAENTDNDKQDVDKPKKLCGIIENNDSPFLGLSLFVAGLALLLIIIRRRAKT